jgi:hypothetical protein
MEHVTIKIIIIRYAAFDDATGISPYKIIHKNLQQMVVLAG